KLLF
ncbi:Glycosyl transferase family 8, partial [Haemophilus influenzae]